MSASGPVRPPTLIEALTAPPSTSEKRQEQRIPSVTAETGPIPREPLLAISKTAESILSSYFRGLQRHESDEQITTRTKALISEIGALRDLAMPTLKHLPEGADVWVAASAVVVVLDKLLDEDFDGDVQETLQSLAAMGAALKAAVNAVPADAVVERWMFPAVPTAPQLDIPQANRTKPMGLGEAARYMNLSKNGKHRQSSKQAAASLKRLMNQGTIPFLRLGRQKYIFDLRSFPMSSLDRITPP
jgi:hypothetical protein